MTAPAAWTSGSGIDPFDTAPLSCAGVTIYKAVKVGYVRPADLVAIMAI